MLVDNIDGFRRYTSASDENTAVIAANDSGEEYGLVCHRFLLLSISE